jgi:uncharacterized Rossmann fold enzyme
MSAPLNELINYEYQNPHASMPMVIPMLVVCNTSDEDLARNVRYNTALDLEWIKPVDARQHSDVAIMIGGGASVEDHIKEIHELRNAGGTVFAMNGASKWATDQGINVDYQVIADAKAETSTLIDPLANNYLLASQVHADTMNAVMGIKEPKLWHLETGNIEADFAPKEKYGGYALIGGGASVGNSAMCVAYTLGFRELHLFGYDSSHTDDRSHAYDQPMNTNMPCVDVKWGGETYKTSVAMKAQAEKFQMTSQALEQVGCDLKVYGDGLLQAMYRTEAKNLSEQEKYQTMWQFDLYRDTSPGEHMVDTFLELAKPDSLIIDFGCGTGRACLAMSEKGHDVLAMDFASNCRDQEAMVLPFIEWDLTQPIPSRARYGFCTDVMEHIPPEDVKAVVKNIMEAAENVFFQISTVDDIHGKLIGAPLHLSVYIHGIWKEIISEFGDIEWSHDQGTASLFYVKRKVN